MTPQRHSSISGSQIVIFPAIRGSRDSTASPRVLQWLLRFSRWNAAFLKLAISRLMRHPHGSDQPPLQSRRRTTTCPQSSNMLRPPFPISIHICLSTRSSSMSSNKNSAANVLLSRPLLDHPSLRLFSSPPHLRPLPCPHPSFRRLFRPSPQQCERPPMRLIDPTYTYP